MKTENILAAAAGLVVGYMAFREKDAANVAGWKNGKWKAEEFTLDDLKNIVSLTPLPTIKSYGWLYNLPYRENMYFRSYSDKVAEMLWLDKERMYNFLMQTDWLNKSDYVFFDAPKWFDINK